MTTPNENKNITSLSRSLGVSALLGMGLTAETLQLDDKRLHYEGVDPQWIIWRLARVKKSVYLKDITALTRSFSIHPILILLGLICVINIFANIVGLDSWFNLPFWRLPFLGFILPLLGPLIGNWLIIHSVMLLIYLVVIWLSKRRYIVFDVHGHSAIRFRADGVGGQNLNSFQTKFFELWHSSKATVA